MLSLIAWGHVLLSASKPAAPAGPAVPARPRGAPPAAPPPPPPGSLFDKVAATAPKASAAPESGMSAVFAALNKVRHPVTCML